MKLSLILYPIIFLLIPLTAFSEDAPTFQRNDFATWPKASVKEFGCFMEKELDYKDKKFNCSLKKYVNMGDPCKNTTKYYEGPQLPKAAAQKIDAKIKSIHFDWEHGDLQNVSITLKDQYSEKEVKEFFKLPDNAIIQKCGKTATCIDLKGFDHMGAGDVDCGG